MNLNFIGINEKFLNLDGVFLVEDTTDDDGIRCMITSIAGDQIELTGSDAERVFDRAEILSQACDALIARIQAAAAQPEPIAPEQSHQ